MSKNFLFIHGAYHGAWCWDEVKHLLLEQGHNAYAIDLPGHGEDTTDRSTVHIADYVEKVERYIVQQNLNDVVLVGHSFAGVVISKLMERIPEKIQKIFFASAVILDEGECFFDYFPPEVKKKYEELAEKNNGSIPPNHDGLKQRLFNGLNNDEKFEKIFSQLTPQPFHPYTEKVFLKNFKNLQTPITYLFLKQDVSLPSTSFQKFFSRLPSSSQQVELDSDHEIMFSHPNELIKAITN